jgi:L-threonylcarbamoyladenylate synthase
MAPKETISSYEGHGDVVICVGDRQEQTTVAAGLYAALRDFDSEGVEYIYAESFRGEGLSYAIMNRLLKAAGQRVIKV